MKFITDYKIEDFVLKTKWTDLPEAVKSRAVVCGIDLFIALLVGSKGRQFEVGCRLAKEYCSAGDIEIIGASRLSLLGAAIAMGHASNSFDIDDGHNMIKGHPGTSIVAGLLAAASHKNTTFREYLTALYVSYEVAIRCGIAMQDHYGYLHSTGSYGAFGTTAGVGRLLDFDRLQLNNALSIADFHAPMTPVMRSVAYPSMNKDGVPFGSLIGMMAVLETRAGSTGKCYLLEEQQYASLTGSLGIDHEIMNLYFKPYTCCRWAHQPIKACLELRKRFGFTESEVRKATIHTFASAAALSKEFPTETDAAQYNIAFPVASALVHGDVGYLQVREEALSDQKVAEMMSRLEFIVDPNLEALFPQKRKAWVEILLSDGRRLESNAVEADGEKEDGIGLDWIMDKFRRITSPFISNANQEKLLGLCTRDLDIPMRTMISEINSCLASKRS